MKNHRPLHALWPFLALLTFLFPSAAVKADSLSELGGKPFGNPSHIATMPANWVERPIVYAPSAQGNDLVVPWTSTYITPCYLSSSDMLHNRV